MILPQLNRDAVIRKVSQKQPAPFYLLRSYVLWFYLLQFLPLQMFPRLWSKQEQSAEPCWAETLVSGWLGGDCYKE